MMSLSIIGFVASISNFGRVFDKISVRTCGFQTKLIYSTYERLGDFIYVRGRFLFLKVTSRFAISEMESSASDRYFWKWYRVDFKFRSERQLRLIVRNECDARKILADIRDWQPQNFTIGHFN